MIGVAFAGRNEADTEDDIIYIGINSHWDAHTIHLPELPGRMQWHLAVNTNGAHPDDCYAPKDMPEIYNGVFTMPPRTVIIAQAKIV